MKHTTKFEGYEVVETTNGLDIYNGEKKFLCELTDMTLEDFSHCEKNGITKIDDVKLESAIKEELGIEDNRNR